MFGLISSRRSGVAWASDELDLPHVRIKQTGHTSDNHFKTVQTRKVTVPPSYVSSKQQMGRYRNCGDCLVFVSNLSGFAYLRQRIVDGNYHKATEEEIRRAELNDVFGW